MRIEFGAYVQTHEAHSNDMEARTIGAIFSVHWETNKEATIFYCL